MVYVAARFVEEYEEMGRYVIEQNEALEDRCSVCMHVCMVRYVCMHVCMYDFSICT